MIYENTHRRALAHLVDSFVFALPVYIFIDIVISFIGYGNNTDNITTTLTAFMFLGYLIATEGLYGQSIGKKTLPAESFEGEWR